MGVKGFTIVLFIAIICCGQICFGEAYYNRPTSNQQLQQDFSDYMYDVQTKLQKNWTPPDFLEEGHTRVLFRINRNGHVISANIIESSGDSIYDESAFEAIRKSEPFNKFPEQSTRENITINYSFDTSLVKTDKMKSYYEQAKSCFYTDKKAALNYINLAIAEVQGDDGGYFLYKRRGKIKEALGDYVGAREDFKQYEQMKLKADIKRVHALKHQAEVEDTAFAYYYLAYAYEQIKDYDNAIDAINQAINRTELNNQYKKYRSELIRKSHEHDLI
jgi:TonB family protein